MDVVILIATVFFANMNHYVQIIICGKDCAPIRPEKWFFIINQILYESRDKIYEK